MKKCIAESAVVIRSKNRFWRAAMRREGGGDENIFIAKIRDSESVQRAFARRRSVAMRSKQRRLHNARVYKMPAAQAFSAISTNARTGFSCVFASFRQCIAVLSTTARRALSHRRVNTSLSGTLFFLWCWCIRDACISIPECTQRLSHLTYIRRATWPRKLRRQRRRRAQ